MEYHKECMNILDEKTCYLIHHMHHYEKTNRVEHELHHCYLFSKKDMKGERYKIAHRLIKNKLYHILDKICDKKIDFVFDHQNYKYNVNYLKYDNQCYFFIKEKC